MSDSQANYTFTLPDDPALLAQLQQKLVEYNKSKSERVSFPGNVDSETLAHQCNAGYRDALYKHTVLVTLLRDKRVVTNQLCLRMRAQYRELFNIDDFENACGVIAGYLGQHGEQTAGGTGLPQVA